MKQQAVNPFVFLTEEQVKAELEKIEREKDKKEIILVDTNVSKPKYVINNKTNPFLDFCKRAYDFVKDNIKVSISTIPFNRTLKVGDFIPDTSDKIKAIPLPNLRTTITAGPVELEIESEDIKSIADCLAKK